MDARVTKDRDSEERGSACLKLSATSIVEPFSDEYRRALAAKHISEEAARKAGDHLHLIKVVPEEANFLGSNLRRDGYSVRQHIVW